MTLLHGVAQSLGCLGMTQTSKRILNGVCRTILFIFLKLDISKTDTALSNTDEQSGSTQLVMQNLFFYGKDRIIHKI